jgi:excisionase family DNA binding protein
MPKPTMESRMMNVKQAAAYLNTTVWFVRTLIWNRRIPFVKFGNRLLLDKKDLDAFIDRQKVAAM